MANWCDFYMDVKCATSRGAEELFDYLKLRQSIADDKDEGMFIGSAKRYLFFGESDINKGSVILKGSVKWCVHPEDFEDMVNFVLERTAVNSIKLEYEELGCGEYGEFLYKDDKIIHKYIPYDVLVNELPEDGELYPTLFRLMDHKAVTEVVKTYN